AGLVLGEVAGDRGLAAGGGLLHLRGGDHQAVQHDAEGVGGPLAVVQGRGQVGEALGALLGEAHVHDVVAGRLPGGGDVGGDAGALDRGAGDDLRAQQVLRRAVRVAGDYRFVGGGVADLLLLRAG